MSHPRAGQLVTPGLEAAYAEMEAGVRHRKQLTVVCEPCGRVIGKVAHTGHGTLLTATYRVPDSDAQTVDAILEETEDFEWRCPRGGIPLDKKAVRTAVALRDKKFLVSHHA